MRLPALVACWTALAFALPAAPAEAGRGTDTRAELIRAMELRPGMVVADVGSGWGYMLRHLSRAVGPTGRVLAEDVSDRALRDTRRAIRDNQLENVTVIHGASTDPRLPAGEVDLALVRDAYHHFDHPREMLAAIRKALRPEGRLVIVDYYKRPGAMRGADAVSHIRADEPEVIQEVEAAGFRLVRSAVHVEGSQYLLIFRKE